MSGYFARLSAQLQSPSGPARRAAAPAPLEQQVEAQAPLAAQAPGEAHEQQVRSAAPTQTPSQAEQAWPLKAAMREAAEALPSAPGLTAIASQAREATIAVRPSHDPVASDRHVEVHAPMFTALAPTETPQPASQAKPRSADGADRIDRNTEAPASRATPHAPGTVQPAAPRSALVDHLSWLAEAPVQDMSRSSQHATEARPAAFVRPTAQNQAALSAERGQTTKTMSPPAPVIQPERPTVRIGTITLEVHPPAVTAPAAPQPVAATPNPAPSQFSLRRHHLRWS